MKKDNTFTPSLSWAKFIDQVNTEMPSALIIEFGTRKWGSKSTHSKNLFTSHRNYILSDFLPGEDVELVHDLHKPFQHNHCEVVIIKSVFEHVEKPWVVADNLYDMLSPGGVLFLSTHHTFPLHGYPSDYFRFSDKALLSCFAGRPWNYVKAEMTGPCAVVPLESNPPVWDFTSRGWLSSVLVGKK